MLPADAVAVPSAGRLTPSSAAAPVAEIEPATATLPATSRATVGAVVPIPTLPPDSNIAEGSMAQAAVNLATWFAVAVPSLVIAAHAASGKAPGIACGLATEAAAAPAAAGAASRKAEGGRPPRVCLLYTSRCV